MQQNYNVISKGEYAHEQTNDFLHVERFLIIRKRARRLLLLDFNNLSQETLTGLQLSIEQFDARGNFLGEVVDEIKKTSFKSGKFILKRAIALERGCMDVRVKIMRAQYGNYAYCLGETGTYAVFERNKKWKKLKEDAIEEKTGANGRMQAFRRFSTPILVSILAVIIMVASLITGIIHVSGFTRDEDEFFLSNIRYRYVDGVKEAGSPVCVIGAIGQGGRNLYIPNEIEGHPVLKVEAGSFYGNSIMHEVKIAKNVEVAANAFTLCNNLEKVTLEGNNIVEDYAFADCNALKEIQIKEVATIGYEAFARANALQSLTIDGCSPNYTTAKIASRAFADCGTSYDPIDEIRLNVNVSYAERETIFAGTRHVEKLYLKNYNNTNFETNINKPLSALFGGSLDGLKEVEIDAIDCIPASFMEYASDVETIKINNLTSSEIGEAAFKYCTQLTTLSLPRKITALGNSALSNTKIASFDASAITSLGWDVFSDCQQLTNVDFGSECTLTTLPDGTFNNCTALTSFVVPSSIRHIQGRAFAYCSSLASVALPENLQTLGEYAFAYCSSLQEIALPGHITDFGTYTFYNCSALTRAALNYGITSIPENTFSYCTSLSSVTLPQSVRTIGLWAFNYCEKLETIVLPVSITTIESGAFDCCYRLHEVYNYTSLPLTAGSSDYGGVAYNALAVLTNANHEVSVTEIDGYVFKHYGGVWALVDYKGSAQSVVLDKMSGNAHTVSSYKVFRNAFTNEDESVRTITLTKAVSEWRDYAFINLPHLTTVYIKEGVRTLPNYLFDGCTSLDRIVLPQVYYNGMISANTFDSGYWSNCRFYYEGSQILWGKKGYTLPSYSHRLYYYADCIHSDNEWNYENGEINTQKSDFESVTVKEPTCKKDGIAKGRCLKCGYTTEQYTLYALGHSYNEYSECTRCEYMNGFMPNHSSIDKFKEIVEITNDRDNPFDLFERDYWGIYAPEQKWITAVLKFKAKENIIMSFHAAANGEGITLTIKGDGKTKTLKNDSNYFTFELKAGETVVITYQDGRNENDNSWHSAYLNSISITSEKEPQ